MSYDWPAGLFHLRDWLRAQSVDIKSIKTERQAAFFVQNLGNQRFKFPARGESCFPLLQKLQGIICAGAKTTREVPTRGKSLGKAKKKRSDQKHVTAFQPMDGLVIYCDGCCHPNPGDGGWSFVVYRDGKEIHSDWGGLRGTTNQVMELTAALLALRWFADQGRVESLSLRSDSLYVVNGCNDWRIKWAKLGWKRKGENAAPEKQAIANLGLWQALDEVLHRVPITLQWVKGHAGIVGNERADELAEIGRLENMRARDEVDRDMRSLAQQRHDLVQQQLIYEIEKAVE